jgi:hypothetical protein
VIADLKDMEGQYVQVNYAERFRGGVTLATIVAVKK